MCPPSPPPPSLLPAFHSVVFACSAVHTQLQSTVIPACIARGMPCSPNPNIQCPVSNDDDSLSTAPRQGYVCDRVHMCAWFYSGAQLAIILITKIAVGNIVEFLGPRVKGAIKTLLKKMSVRLCISYSYRPFRTQCVVAIAAVLGYMKMEQAVVISCTHHRCACAHRYICPKPRSRSRLCYKAYACTSTQADTHVTVPTRTLQQRIVGDALPCDHVCMCQCMRGTCLFVLGMC
jgi:hypothetical protein